MPSQKPIALSCKIFRGGFSGERVIQVVTADRGVYKGLAPTHYCWTQDGRVLKANEPEPGQEMDGRVAARELRDFPPNQVVVTTPDGEVFLVARDIVTCRPEPELASHVPL